MPFSYKYRHHYILSSILCITLLSLPVFIHAQQTQAPRHYEEKGEALLRRASEKLKSFQTMRVQFSYIMENTSQNINERMDGTLLSKGDQYHMQVGDNLFISDGTNMWTFLEEIDEVHISLLADSEGGMTPTSILNEFDSQFTAKFIRQERHEGKLVDIIDLVPKQPQPFFKYRVALNAADQMLVYATAFDRHGGTYTYNILRFETNVAVDPGSFRFDVSKFPGIEVIDLR